MPIGSAMITPLQVPAITETQRGTGELVTAYDYTASPTLMVRFVEYGTPRPIEMKPGQWTQISAVAIFDAHDLDEVATSLDTLTGERMQIKCNGSLWELLFVTDAGNLGRMKMMQLRRWK